MPGSFSRRWPSCWPGVPILPELFAWHARMPGTVERLIEATGSRLDPEGIRLYARLIRNSSHDGAALAMMANWDLRPLVADVPRLQVPLLLIAGGNDRTVPPAQSAEIRDMVPGATLKILPGLGHLAHEEAPGQVAPLIEAFAERIGVLA